MNLHKSTDNDLKVHTQMNKISHTQINHKPLSRVSKLRHAQHKRVRGILHNDNNGPKINENLKGLRQYIYN